MYGVGIVMAKLVDNFLNILMVSFENGVADDFLESEAFSPWLACGSINGRHHLTILQRSLFPPIIELVIQQALNRVVHCSDKDSIYSKLISLNRKSSVHGGGAMSGSGLGGESVSRARSCSYVRGVISLSYPFVQSSTELPVTYRFS